MNAQSPKKGLSTLKSALFGSSSSSPPIIGVGGGLVCDSVCKADLLPDHFGSKQFGESVQQITTGREELSSQNHREKNFSVIFFNNWSLVLVNITNVKIYYYFLLLFILIKP